MNIIIDILSVLISGIGVEQLLGIPKLSTGSISPSIYCHPMFDRVEYSGQGCCFVLWYKAGHRSGACCLIEQKLNKAMLFQACRHHVMELIIIGDTFKKTSIGTSTGPNIPISRSFKTANNWLNTINFRQPQQTLSWNLWWPHTILTSWNSFINIWLLNSQETATVNFCSS